MSDGWRFLNEGNVSLVFVHEREEKRDVALRMWKAESQVALSDAGVRFFNASVDYLTDVAHLPLPTEAPVTVTLEQAKALLQESSSLRRQVFIDKDADKIEWLSSEFRGSVCTQLMQSMLKHNDSCLMFEYKPKWLLVDRFDRNKAEFTVREKQAPEASTLDLLTFHTKDDVSGDTDGAECINNALLRSLLKVSKKRRAYWHFQRRLVLNASDVASRCSHSEDSILQHTAAALGSHENLQLMWRLAEVQEALFAVAGASFLEEVCAMNEGAIACLTDGDNAGTVQALMQHVTQSTGTDTSAPIDMHDLKVRAWAYALFRGLADVGVCLPVMPVSENTGAEFDRKPYVIDIQLKPPTLKRLRKWGKKEAKYGTLRLSSIGTTQHK